MCLELLIYLNITQGILLWTLKGKAIATFSWISHDNLEHVSKTDIRNGNTQDP
jgi:hypothetical protein